MRPKHPGHFLMGFHQACDKITAAHIMQRDAVTIDVFTQMYQNTLMIREQVFYKTQTVVFLSGLLRQVGEL